MKAHRTPTKAKKSQSSVLTINQAAMQADMSPDKIRYMAERGLFPAAVREGDDWIIVRSRLEQWLNVEAAS